MPSPGAVGALSNNHIISSFSGHSIVAGLPLAGSVASAVLPATNLATYVPFRISIPITILGFFCMNGVAVAGNIDIGVYDCDGSKITSTGAIAQSGTSAIQQSALGTSIRIDGGKFYYLALWAANTSATFFRASTYSISELRHMGITDEVVATNLPANQTRSTPGFAYIPVFGLYTARAL